MNRLRPTVLAAACAATSLFAQDDRDRTTPVATQWLTGQTPAQIGQLANNGWRVTDLEVESTSPWTFTVATVQNAGAYAKSWWWAYDVTPTQLTAALTQNNARLVDLEPYDSNGATRFAALMVSNTGVDNKTWQWGFDQTQSQVDAAVQQFNGRLTSLKRYVVGGQTRFASAMIANTGADQRSWGYLYGATSAQIDANLAAFGNRVYGLERTGTDSFDVILIASQAVASWWYFDVTSTQLTNFLQQDIGRIIDVERRVTLLGTRYDVATIDNANVLERRARGVFLAAPAAARGEHGFFLKEVNGPVLAQMRPDTPFEPSGTMTTVYHAHAMKAVANGAASLTQPINKPQACGVPGASVPLETLLAQMMESGDDLAALAVSNYFGIPQIGSTAAALGMSSTSIQYTLGCSGPSPESSMTLRDVARLHEQVASGYLGAQRARFYELMTESQSFPSGGTDSLDARIAAEATALGLPFAARLAFIQQLRIVYRPGGIGWTGPGTYTCHYADAGWMSVPFRGAGGVDLTKEYAFGAFNHRFTGAANEALGRDAMSDAELELVWDRVRAALATWVDYTPAQLSTYGVGCPGSAGVPNHTTTGSGEIGAAFQFACANLPGSTVALLALGFSDQSWNGVPLPLDLAVVGAPGCLLRQDGAITEAIVASGSTQRSITLPNTPSIIGANLYSQFLVADAPANALGWTISNARKLVVGGWQ